MKYVINAIFVAMVMAPLIGFIPPGEKNKKKRKFIDPVNMDLSVKPGDNFYLYANGNWLKRNPVPASKTRWGSFSELVEENSKRLQALLQEAANNATNDPKMQKIGHFYVSGMDSATIEKLGYQPIKPHLDRINGLKDIDGLIKEMSFERANSVSSPLVGIFISQDRKNVSQYIAQINQGGITLPDRDYYFMNDSRSVNIRKEYLSHLSKMFALIGQSQEQASVSADAVIRIETALAKAQFSRVESRDPYKTYNKFSWKDLSVTTPSIDWQKYAEQMMIRGLDSVVVVNPSYLKTIDVLFSAVPVADWKSYLQWKLLSGAAPYLSNAFVEQNFRFTQVLTGQKQMTPRWQRISNLIDASLGDELGRLYVQKYFKSEAKQRMLDLVNNLQQTFSERIKKLDWMSEETKQKGLEKLEAFSKKIAYPDKWKDYGTVVIKTDDFFGNVQRAGIWEYQDMVSRIGKPVDKTLWSMTPPTINAYYSPVNNEIAFPAGILQFPFFDFEADDAINYGGIGAVIGHEITHGFDDQGRQYSATGNLSDWWTEDDADKFKTRANMVMEQFNEFTVLDSIHVNGRLTLGENLADLGGLSIAYDAFTKTDQFKQGKKIDGFTPAQRFFLNWAQVWRINSLPEIEAQFILTDPHSPGMYRANGPVVNMDAWYEAFDVKEGDKMFKPKDKRINIW